MVKEGGTIGGEDGFERRDPMLEKGECCPFPLEERTLEGEVVAVHCKCLQDGGARDGGVKGRGMDSLSCVCDELGEAEEAAVAERGVVWESLEFLPCLVDGVRADAAHGISVEPDCVCSEHVVVL